MLNKRLLFVVDLIAILGQAYSAPAAASSQEDSITLELGIKFDKRSDSLPTLTLPYSTYQAASYDSTSDIYTFTNIRFAAPPLGDLRWAAPAAPVTNTTLQDGSYGNMCVQVEAKGLNFAGPLNDDAIGTLIDNFFANVGGSLFSGGDEDCLFLDLYVPGAAIDSPSTTSLPVVVWFYGGAYLFGAKDHFAAALPFYNAEGLLAETGNNVIFVAGNYRLASYGFLAGKTMEEEGLPNAGLYDQRAVLQWVQDYISLVGGNASDVSAWGESAGAGSIMHHLVAQGGTQDPLFTKAVVQSPAFQTMWDRDGYLEEVFQNFSTAAGCAGQGLSCLRNASSATLEAANYQLNYVETVDGVFLTGPAADGTLIRQLAALEFASGNYWKDLDSLIISHTSSEAVLFVDGSVATDAEFNEFLIETAPEYVQTSGINADIEAFYPGVDVSSTYATETDRMEAFVGESRITCNTRFLTDAYSGKTYNMQYSVLPGYHATDLIPTFYSSDPDLLTLVGILDEALSALDFGSLADSYQSYLISHARTGNPNTYRSTTSPYTTLGDWPIVDNSGNELTNVLNVGDSGFSLISDTTNTNTTCNFWLNVDAAVTILGGYAPPGSVVPSTLVSSTANASVNY